MKTIFSPDYTEKPYVNYQQNGGILFNTIFVNNSKLLNILKLRAGLTSSSTSTTGREARYIVVVKKMLMEHSMDHRLKKTIEMWLLYCLIGETNLLWQVETKRFVMY